MARPRRKPQRGRPRTLDKRPAPKVQAAVGKLALKPGDSWLDPQGNLWIVSTDGRPVNLGQSFGRLLAPYTGPKVTGTDESGRPVIEEPPPSETGGILDFEAMLGLYGMPPDVVAEVKRIFSTNDDPQQAALLAISYVRGTDWHKQTYPGFGEGVRLGLIGDERGYRSYTNQVNTLYRQFYGRDVAGAEVADWLNQGANVDFVGGKLGGEAWAKANAADVQYAAGAFTEEGRLSDADLRVLGEQQAGLASTRGTDLDVRLEKAFARARRVFEGVLATPSLSLSDGRLSSQSLGGGRASDVGR